MRLPLLLAAAIAAGACFAASSHAQTEACAEDDLKCRIKVLEQRLDAMTQRQATTEAKVAAAPPPAPTVFSLLRSCRTNCQEEAAAACAERGFPAGRAKDWDRPKTGPLVLTRIACSR
jgi:hypothetical protein